MARACVRRWAWAPPYAFGMSDEVSIRVNFSRPLPIFALDSVVVLPQQVLPLHIFEPRYRQMVERALDGAGQIAMAVFRGPRWKQEYHGNPPIRPAVCVSQILQHEKLPDGRYNILLQGVCRARVLDERLPDEERMYREAMLEPVGLEGDAGAEGESLREWLDGELEAGALSRFVVAEQVLEYVRNDGVPTSALLELVSFAMLTEADTRYRLLAEGDASRRLRLIRGSLEGLARLVRSAQAQKPEDWPKGCSWN